MKIVNECLAIGGGGNVGNLVFTRNYSMASRLPREVKLVTELIGLPGSEV